MHYDIDTIIDQIRSLFPAVHIERYRAKHTADVNGLWLFRLPGRTEEIQVESSTCNIPFLIGTLNARDSYIARNVAEAIATIQELLSRKVSQP